MAVRDPRKVFQFKIAIGGIDQFAVQEIQRPEVENEAATHGATNYRVKTSGQVLVADAVLTMVSPAPFSDTWAWQWLSTAQDMNAESGNLSSFYKRDLIVSELAPDFLTVLNQEIWLDCFVRKIKPSNNSRVSSDNLMREVTLYVDRVLYV
jgi:hypothetical protein